MNIPPPPPPNYRSGGATAHFAKIGSHPPTLFLFVLLAESYQPLGVFHRRIVECFAHADNGTIFIIRIRFPPSKSLATVLWKLRLIWHWRCNKICRGANPIICNAEVTRCSTTSILALKLDKFKELLSLPIVNIKELL